MDKGIRKIILVLLKHETLVASWGVTDIVVIGKSLTFHVDGFCYTGNVQIQHRDNGYYVEFEDGKILSCTEDDIVEKLDATIERASNYELCLKKWIIRGGS